MLLGHYSPGILPPGTPFVTNVELDAQTAQIEYFATDSSESFLQVSGAAFIEIDATGENHHTWYGEGSFIYFEQTLDPGFTGAALIRFPGVMT